MSTENEKKWPGGEVSETHPSYGMVRFSRRQGNPGRLFGSPVEDHQAYVTLVVARGESITSDHGYTRYYGGLRGDLIEVDMSAAQFAELLTSMNVGSGVPCTVRYHGGTKIENPPNVKVEIERVRDAFKERIEAINDQARKDAKEAAELLDKKAALTVAERKLLKEKLDRTFREVDSNTPYMLKLFEEAAEKVVTHAKAEIDAFVAHNVISEGIRAIASRLNEEPSTPILPEGSGTSEPNEGG